MMVVSPRGTDSGLKGKSFIYSEENLQVTLEEGRGSWSSEEALLRIWTCLFIQVSWCWEEDSRFGSWMGEVEASVRSSKTVWGSGGNRNSWVEFIFGGTKEKSRVCSGEQVSMNYHSRKHDNADMSNVPAGKETFPQPPWSSSEELDQSCCSLAPPSTWETAEGKL